MIEAVERSDGFWHAVIILPQYVPLERLGPRGHLLPAQRRIGNSLGIADVLCHPSDYKSHRFSINEAWLAGVPVVSCDYLVNRRFEACHRTLMWVLPVEPEPTMLAVAIDETYSGREVTRLATTWNETTRGYSAQVAMEGQGLTGGGLRDTVGLWAGPRWGAVFPGSSMGQCVFRVKFAEGAEFE